MVYPADSTAMKRADALIDDSGFAITELARMMDPGIAGAELLRHAFLERWLECGAELEALYDVCSTVFERQDFERRLLQAYLLRFAIFNGVNATSKLLLSNERLLPLITRFAPPESGEEVHAADDDVIAFEIFRHLLSPRLDPLSSARTELLADILANRIDELTALKRQCERLSEKLSGVQESELFHAVTTLVHRHVAEELAVLLRLSARAKQDFMVELLADKLTWVSLIGSAAGTAAGTTGVSLAGGIAAIATAIAKGVDVGWRNHKAVRDNPYRLIRRLGEAVPDDLS
jgi:hypothetical protein